MLRDPQNCLSGTSLHCRICVRRTSSSLSYSRQSSLSDDSGISVSSGRNAVGRERSETREPSSGGYSRARDSSKTTTTTLGRRFDASASTLSGISVTEMFNKYSPSNYMRCNTDSTTDSIYSRSHSATAASARRSVGVGGAVGGCSTPSLERRSRLNSTEVILQFNNNNQVSSEEDEDDNGNETQLSVADIRRRFDSSSPATATPQNDGAVRRHPVKSSPSPVLTRKVYSSSKAEARLSSSEDEEDEEEGEEYKQQTREGDINSRRSPAGRVAGGAASSPSSVAHQHTPPPESPKPSKFGHQLADAVSSVICVSLPVCRPRARCVRFSCINSDVGNEILIHIGLSLLPVS